MYKVKAGESRITACAAKETSRYAINGVLLDSGGMAVATDGRRLMACTVESEGETHDMIVPVDEFVRAVKLIKAKSPLHRDREVEFTNGDGVHFKAACAGVTIESQQVEGHFPRWREVVPRHVGTAFCVNRKLLAEMLSAMPPASGETDSLVYIGMTGHDKPIVMWCPTQDAAGAAIGVLMPLAGPSREEVRARWREAYRRATQVPQPAAVAPEPAVEPEPTEAQETPEPAPEPVEAAAAEPEPAVSQ